MQISIHQLKSGERLAEDVLTPLGNVLVAKHKQVEQHDIDMMRAFLIKHVVVQALGGEQNTIIEQKLSFQQGYDKLIQLLKKVFPAAAQGIAIPLIEIRGVFEQLLKHINDYKPLSFKPSKFEIKDFLYHHSIMTALTAYKLADWHNLPKHDLIPIGISGLLHDIGSLAMDQDIFWKEDKLTRDDREQIKKHPVLGYQILKNLSGINEGVKLCTLQHHERMDGTGYPLGITGEQIHIYAKVLAIADTFHAMVSDRIYRKKESPYLALEELHKNSFGKYDPSLVQTFIRKVTLFQSGTIVRLNNQAVGEIIFTDRDYPTRPLVKVDQEIINLRDNLHIYIEEVISA